MTGTIEDGYHVSDDADPLRSDPLGSGPLGSMRSEELREIDEAAALLEQAKGVLIFRYSIGACTAYRLMERWAADASVDPETVAHALVHEICQGDRSEPSDPKFVRWLEDRLRHEFPGEPYEVPAELPPVTVAVDQSDSSLDAVVEAAREASRRCVPLEVTAAPESLQGVQQDQVQQRVDLAVELARAVAPGLEVRRPR